MTETQRRIKELKRSLPNMKEKVVAVAVLLALSLTMMASVSYAWYTMSFAPEVSGVNTTVSSNGSLEIALSGSDGTEPGASLVGDSFAAQNQTTHNANITWGNLINLSGNYGIESIVLRPATFNPDAKSTGYLSSVKYSDDGRIEGTTTDFAFTTWTNIEGVDKFAVSAGNIFGVRAISSVGFDENIGKSVMLLKMEQAREKLKISTDKYMQVYNGETEAGRLYADVIRDVVNVYLDYFAYEKLQEEGLSFAASMYDIKGNPDITKYVPELIEIYQVFYDSIVLYGDALDFLADVQVGMGVAENKVNLGSAKAKHGTLEGNVLSDLNKLREYADDESVSIADDNVLKLINNLVDINSSYINGGGIDNKQVQTLLGSMSEALKIVTSLDNNAVISVLVTKGNMKTFEELHGVKETMTMYPLKVVSASRVTGNLSTNASGSLFEDAISRTMSLDTSYLNAMVAEDTYGMVVDLWFRSNSPDGTLLTLDGRVKTVTRYEERKVILTGESKSRTVYSYQRPTGAVISGVEVTEEVLVFKGEEGDTNFEAGAYYSINTYAKVYKSVVQTKDENGKELDKPIVVDSDQAITDADVTVKMDVYEDIVGFESSNRYDGDYIITENGEISATQGSGSCFVFYADSPEAADAAFEMLGQLKLAFMDASGELLAKAEFNVKKVYSESGRYTVPITITETDATVVSDVDGSTIYGITALQQNVATRISVVLYLEGEGLENKMAFSNGSITGSLNFQFSTSEDLNALKNTDLADKIISLSAQLDKTALESYTGSTQTAMLTATVDGLNASEVEAVFVRKINESQGTRITPVSLTRQGTTNNWVGECGFLLPGTYELSSLWVDGVEYKLPEKITISMAGFAVQSVSFCSAKGEEVALTAEGYVNRAVSVTFSSEKQPDKVEARFKSGDGAYVTANLTKNADGSWSGNAIFTDSGVYTLQWIVASIAKPGTDPVAYETAYYELPEGLQKTFTAYLGLRAEVTINNSYSNIRFEFTGARVYSIGVKILTDTGTELRAMNNIRLYYGARGSNVDANGLRADLTWDGAYYVGEFNVDKPGVFNFTRLAVDGNTIAAANSAPSITAISLTPPQYVHSDDTPGVMILGDGTDKAYYVAKIDEFPSGNVFAVFYESANPAREFVVAEDITYRADKEPGYYYFPIPYSSTGTRNGNWVMKELRFTEVYDADGHYYGEGSEDLEAYKPHYTQEVNRDIVVIDTFTVNIDTMVLNNNKAFMDAQKLIDKDGKYFGLTITAPGVNIPEGINISNVQLTLNHQTTGMSAYGGYTYDNTDDAHGNDLATVEDLSMTYSDGRWVVDDGVVARLAGAYTASVTASVTVNGEAVAGGTFTLTDDKPVHLEVYSAKPTVMITDITLDGGDPYAVDLNTSGSLIDTFKQTSYIPAKYTVTINNKHVFAANNKEYISKIVDSSGNIATYGHTAYIYFKCSHTKTSSTWNDQNLKDWIPHDYLYNDGEGVPAATLTLTGFGKASSADLEFAKSDGEDVIMITQYTADRRGGTYWGDYETYGTNKYEWTADGACTRFIGVMDNDAGDHDSDTKTAAGTITASKLVFVFDGVKYSFEIPTITIHNPC